MAVSYTSGSQAISTSDKYNFKEMIEKLRAIEEIPARKLLKWKADWELRVDGFTQIKTSLTSLRDSLSKIDSVDKFLVKGATSSDETVVKATAKSNAQAGDYLIDVEQLARNAISAFSSSGLNSKTAVLNNTSNDQTFEYIYAGTTRAITVPPGTTLTDLANRVNNDPKNPGVRAMIVQDGNMFSFQLRGMDLGAAKTLEITPNTNIQRLGSIPLNSGTNTVTAATVATSAFTFGAGITASTVVNDTGADKDFTINYNGTPTTITLESGKTLSDLVTAINAKKGDTGVTASLSTNSGITTLNLTGNKKGASVGDINIASDIQSTADGIDLGTVWTNVTGLDSTITYTSSTFVDPSGGVSVNSSGNPQNFQYLFNGLARNVSVPDGATQDELITLINATAPTGVTASLSSIGPPYDIIINGAGNTLADPNAVNSLDFSSSSPGWQSQIPQNAQFRVNGWPADPQFLESSTNTIEDVIEGVTLNLRSVGESEVVVSVDNTAIKENVDAFIKAYNTFKTTYAVLTDVDTTKKTYDPDYTDSLFDMQQGGVLTGNYVVQMIGSQLSQILGGAGIGFINAANTPSSDANPKENFWDPFSTLASIGIITDSDKNSSTFGLLIYNPDTKMHDGKTAFEYAMAKDPTAVAELFSAENLGKTNSSDFSFVNCLSGTKPGTYEVSYDIDSDGNIKNPLIDGHPAQLEGNKITSSYFHSGSAGIELEISNLGRDQSYAGQVFIKQGKVNELYDAVSMNDSRTDQTTGEMVNYKGAIQRMTDLIAQYMGDSSGDAKTQGIIKNIEAKIDRENQRLEVWQRFMTSKFARLEAVLGKYEELQKSLESQIKNLSSSSS